jgi:hypothetical protein
MKSQRWRGHVDVAVVAENCPDQPGRFKEPCSLSIRPPSTHRIQILDR